MDLEDSVREITEKILKMKQVISTYRDILHGIGLSYILLDRIEEGIYQRQN